MPRENGLSMCGGRCHELSAVIVLSNPSKNKDINSSFITFERSTYCINKGCGWRMKISPVSMDMGVLTQVGEITVNSCLNRLSKKYSGLPIKDLWKKWLVGGEGYFIDYVSGNANTEQIKLF